MFQSKIIRVALIAILLSCAAAPTAAAATVPVGGGTTYETDSGLSVTISGNHTLESDRNPFLTSESVDLYDIELSAGGDAEITVDKLTGDTQLSAISTSGTWVSVDQPDKQSISVRGELTDLTYGNITVGDGAGDFDIDTDGTPDLRITGLEPSTQYILWDDTASAVLADGSTAGSSTATFSDLPSGTYTAELRTADSFNTPQFSDVAPQDGFNSESRSVTLSARVDDADFPDQTVDVSIVVNNETVHTQSISAAQTVDTEISSEMSAVDLGENDWWVEADDPIVTVKSQTRTFGLPAQLTLRNETAPGQVVTGDGSVEVSFYGDDTIYQRTANDGVVDLSGLPTDQRLVVEPDIDGFYPRQVILDSIHEQSSLYLLNESNTDVVRPTFRVADSTGQFAGGETEVHVDVPLERDGEVQYREVAADRVGSSGFRAVLRDSQRYVISLRAPGGQTKDLGPYTAATEIVELDASAVDYSFRVPEHGYSWDAVYEDGFVDISWTPDGGAVAESLTITVQNRSGGVVYQEQWSETGTDTERKAIVPLENGGSVNWTATLSAGEETWTISGGEAVGPAQQVVLPGSSGGFPQLAITTFAIAATLLVGGLFSAANVSVGGIVTSLVAAAFWFVGAMPGNVSGGLIGLALFISVVYYVSRARQTARPR